MKKQLLFMTLIGVLLSGCGNFDKDVHYESAAVYETAVDEATRAANTNGEVIPASTIPEQKKIIKNGRMGIQVAEISPAKQRVDSLVRIYNGYYGNESYTDSQSNPSVSMTIRIPGANYEAFISALETGKGKTLYKNISAQDVTEAYLDIETRLTNKRSYLERYREILRRATTIKEIMEVEQYIRALEEEIESAQGRLRYLDSQVGYSTLELTLSTEYKYTAPKEDRFPERVKTALSVGWQGIVHFFVGLLYLWPFLLIGGGIWFWIRKRMKRKKK